MDLYFQRLKNLSYGTKDIFRELKLSESGAFETFYAPFEHVNESARVVLCGITPGAKQAEIAINTALQAIATGASDAEALKKAKETASFAGRMRDNLAEMLDYIGLQNALGISAARSLFADKQGLVHYTSALRNPVFKNGKNYSGSSEMIRSDYLWNQIKEGLQEELNHLRYDVIIVPLGGSVEAVFEKLANHGHVDEERVLFGLPHPSGANAERIAYFCGRKPKDTLSPKTNAFLIDVKRDRLINKVKKL